VSDEIYEIYRERYEKRKRRRVIKTILEVLVFMGIAALILFIILWQGWDRLEDSRAGVVAAEVIRVVDGDTLLIFYEGKETYLRMIGVDAPESVSPVEEENTPLGVAAADFTKTYFPEGKEIYLTFDEELVDGYDRMLAYVWLEEDVSDTNALFQKILVENGYAEAVKYEPNDLYYTLLYTFQEDARRELRGMWANEEETQKINQR